MWPKKSRTVPRTAMGTLLHVSKKDLHTFVKEVTASWAEEKEEETAKTSACTVVSSGVRESSTEIMFTGTVNAAESVSSAV